MRMSKYYDRALDPSGEAFLDRVIKLSEDNPWAAVRDIDALIARYPSSPQLQISKSIFLYVEKAADLMPFYKTAIGLDPGFHDAYRRLSNAHLCECLSFAGISQVRTAHMHARLQAGGDRIKYGAALRQYLRPDWKARYDEGARIGLEGIRRLDRARYPADYIREMSEVAEFQATAPDEVKVAFIAMNHEKVVASKLFKGKQFQELGQHDRIAYWPPR